MNSNQEFFDTVVAALIEQGQPSAGSGGCLYRGPGGTKCAIGILIPDQEYDEVPIEDMSVESLVLSPERHDTWPTLMSLSEKVDVNLMSAMQNAHDGANTYYNSKGLVDLFDTEQKPAYGDPNWVESFKSRAKQVAEAWGLQHEL